MTHLEIANRALVAAGSNPKEDFLNTHDNEITSVVAVYEASWREVLAAHPWSELLQEERMQGEPSGSEYIYIVPEQCIRIVSAKAWGGRDVSFRRRAGLLYAQEEAFTLTFVSTDGILPVDWEFADIEIRAMIPPDVDEAVSLKVASQIALRISQNQALQSHLTTRYMMSLDQAKMNDMVGEEGSQSWGGKEWRW